MPSRDMLRPMNLSSSFSRPGTCALLLRLLIFQLLAQCAAAVFITFENCLDTSIVNSHPRQLQLVPFYFDAQFDTLHPSHNLNLIIYGNVSGQATEGVYPPPTDPSWSDPDSTFGKIVDVSPTGKNYTTLFQRYQVLTYEVYDAPHSEFCLSTVNNSCPLAPSFNGNVSNPYSLSAFTLDKNINSSYAFATITATITIKSGDQGAPNLACISANITPDLGKRVAGLLTYLPAAVLICVAVATAAAAIYSPWGSSDPFKWTTNYGRDEDLLRLVTPGFGDCLQYIQFIFLTGALTLNYPGFYQPAISQASWGALMFNESFVSHGDGYQSLLDGVYSINGTYGMTRMSQLVGMTKEEDVWACMAVWLLVLLAAAVVLCQLAFLLRWLFRQVSNTVEEDLRRKNVPLTAGMLVRVVYNYFLLPIVALSLFQLVAAPHSTLGVVIVAVLLLVGIVVFAGWILSVIFRSKPRAHLFDDLPTVLLYGSLYNTYSDDAAPFAFIPVLLTFMRGVAIGAVQPSGIAQLVILAICEVILILTLHAFRPFSSPTHMNVYHTFFASARLSAVLLMVAFVPSLGVTEAPKGWIGYAILLLHAVVLVFGFFLNALQTMVEVGARMAGAGGDPQLGAQRGGLISYGWRQLRKRQPEKGVNRPGSMTSDAAILANDSDAKSFGMGGGRSRSLSASSRMMLNQNQHRLSGTEQYSQSDYALTPGLETPTATSGLPSNATPSSSGTNQKRPVLGLQTDQSSSSDPYYRPPRARRGTMDAYTPGARSRKSGLSGEWTRPFEEWPEAGAQEAIEGHRSSGSTPPPFYRQTRAGSDPELGEANPRTDYAVREVDFYYGVTRGPALSNQAPARKRKTGPADPMGPVSSATTWMQKVFGGKTKDKGKGFEVVRSSRAPPDLMQPTRLGRDTDEEEGQELQTSPPMTYPPYRDLPTSQALAGAEQGQLPITEKAKRRMPLDGPWDAEESESEASELEGEAGGRPRQGTHTSSAAPPFLAPIERTPSFDLHFPSRTSTYREPASHHTHHLSVNDDAHQPAVPRKSSRRTGSRDVSQDISPAVSPRLPAHLVNERPTSVGLVQQRMTGDGIRQSGVGVGMHGTAAEFVEGERTLSLG